MTKSFDLFGLNGFQGHTKAIQTLSWSPDGFFATGSDEGTVRVWETLSGRAILEYDHNGPVKSEKGE